MQSRTESLPDEMAEVRQLLAHLVEARKTHGPDGALHLARCMIIAGASYLEDVVGPHDATMVLSTTMSTIRPEGLTSH